MTSPCPVRTSTIIHDDDDTMDSLTNLFKGIVTPSTPSFFARQRQGMGIFSSLLRERPATLPPFIEADTTLAPTDDWKTVAISSRSTTLPPFSSTPSAKLFSGTHPSRV